MRTVTYSTGPSLYDENERTIPYTLPASYDAWSIERMEEEISGLTEDLGIARYELRRANKANQKMLAGRVRKIRATLERVRAELDEALEVLA